MKGTHNDIDWNAHLGAPYHERPRSVEEFITHAREQLEPLHVSPEVMEQVNSAGCQVRGVRYFSALYGDGGDAEVKSMVESVFVGSVAHGEADLATEAYDLLLKLDFKKTPEKVNEKLIETMDKAIGQERWYGDITRHDRLAASTKALGKPLQKRVLGRLASSLVFQKRPLSA